jgi:hypothetical protein
MLEELAEHRQYIREMADLTSRCMIELEKLIAIGGQVHSVVEQLRRDITSGDTHGEAS